MNIDMGLMWEGIAQAALNYIVVSTISASNQKQTVTDLKTDLRTAKEDLLAEIKDSKETILAKVDISTTTMIKIAETNLETQLQTAPKKGTNL